MRKPIPKSIRNKVCARQRYNCFDCGERFKSVINIHHIDGDNENNNPDNLVALCHSCHDERHNEEAVRKHLTKKEVEEKKKEEEYSIGEIVSQEKEKVESGIKNDLNELNKIGQGFSI